MKIAVIGAGGVGGYFGARLAAAGADVTFLARGAHLEAMRREGLQVRSPLGDLRVQPVQAEGDPRAVGPVDLVIIAVKLWSTSSAVESARPLVGPATGVLSFQNGVDAVDIVGRAFGPARTMGGVAYIAALIEAPGVIRHNGKLAKLAFGELDGRRSPRAEALLAACRAAGIDAQIPEDVRLAIWEKFVFLVALSGLTCLTRLPIGAIRADPVTRDVLRGAMEETVAVGRASGVALVDDLIDRHLSFIDGVPADMVASMLGDLLAGRRLEVEWLSGAVDRMGREMEVPTPFNRAIYAALKLHADGRPAAAPPRGS